MPDTPIATAPSHESRLATTSQYAKYLIKGQGNAPGSTLQRRTFLRTTRYVLKFIFWRLVRYAKYAAVGAIIAAIGTGVLGTAISAGGALLVPSVPVGMALGVATGLFKFGWRHSRFSQAFKTGAHSDARSDEHADASDDEVVEKPTVWERL